MGKVAPYLREEKKEKRREKRVQKEKRRDKRVQLATAMVRRKRTNWGKQ